MDSFLTLKGGNVELVGAPETIFVLPIGHVVIHELVNIKPVAFICWYSACGGVWLFEIALLLKLCHFISYGR